MSLKERVLQNLEKRRERLLNGDINSIPSPFVRFKDDFVGVEQGRFYLVTAATKGNFVFNLNILIIVLQ